MSIAYTKMHGLGNDYLFIESDKNPIADPAEPPPKRTQWPRAAGPRVNREAACLHVPGKKVIELFGRPRAPHPELAAPQTPDHVPV